MALPATPKDELIVSLYGMGQDPYRIAGIVREEVTYVRRVIRSVTVSKTYSEPQDKELADAMRNLAWRAYEDALDIYENGHPTQKLAITKAILGRTAAMVGQQTTTRYDDMRNDLEELLSGQRGTEAPIEDIDEPTETRSSTLTFDLDDPDEETNY